jgi:hypothetical protein
MVIVDAAGFVHQCVRGWLGDRWVLTKGDDADAFFPELGDEEVVVLPVVAAHKVT